MGRDVVPMPRAACQGVTLLEIMLVLAIAGMIIVMSVRYYQSASQAEQANAFTQQVQGITATVESYSVGGTGYLAATQTIITPLLPQSAFVTPWGATMTYTPEATGFELSIPFPPSRGVCSLIQARLQSDAHYGVTSDCSGVSYSATR